MTSRLSVLAAVAGAACLERPPDAGRPADAGLAVDADAGREADTGREPAREFEFDFLLGLRHCFFDDRLSLGPAECQSNPRGEKCDNLNRNQIRCDRSNQQAPDSAEKPRS